MIILHCIHVYKESRMHFLQKTAGIAMVMHNLHPICENYTLDVLSEDDYTKFQISFIDI